MVVIPSNIDPNSHFGRSDRRDVLALVAGFRTFEVRVRDTSNQELAPLRKRGQAPPAGGSPLFSIG